MRWIIQQFQDQNELFPRDSPTPTFPVEPSIEYSLTLVDKLLDPSLVIRDAVIIYPASDNPDDSGQDTPFVRCVQVLPEEVPESLQFGGETVFPAAVFQSPETFSRFSPIAGKPQKVKRWQTPARRVGSHGGNVSRRN